MHLSFVERIDDVMQPRNTKTFTAANARESMTKKYKIFGKLLTMTTAKG